MSPLALLLVIVAVAVHVAVWVAVYRGYRRDVAAIAAAEDVITDLLAAGDLDTTRLPARRNLQARP